jgi:CBS domain-containing protein
MQRVVKFARPDQTVRDAALVMEEADVGCLPVIHNGRPIGILTDRDIAMRVDAYGKDPMATRVAEVMTERFIYCREDHTVEMVLERMYRENVHRIPVLSRYGHGLVGIVSLEDLAVHTLDNRFVGMILSRGAHTGEAVA